MGTFPIYDRACHFMPRSAPPAGGLTHPDVVGLAENSRVSRGQAGGVSAKGARGTDEGPNRGPAQSLRIDTVVLSFE